MKMSGEKGWKRHFKVSMFSLEHNDPSRFVHGPWRRRSMVHPLFLIYRLVIAIVMIGVTVWSMSDFWNGGKWFIYLTHWGLSISMLEAVIGAVLVFHAYRKQTKPVDSCSSLDVSVTNDGSMPLTYKIYWIIYNIALPNAFYISAMYWGLIHDPNNKEAHGSLPLNYMTHAGNSVIAFLELLLGGPPSRLLHFVQPLAFGLIYMVFNILYWAFGGTDPKGHSWIYEALQWENPGRSTALIFISAALLILCHILVTAIAGLRSRLSRKFREKSKSASSGSIWVSHTPYYTGTSNKSFITDAP
ncbi:protein rolling stone-like [Arctopsyche grandis]|uniref:protein rolling stone-like n=1 Tax=Arctopsyche grandis TaxID=121162 RepID=UPI00406DA49A